MKRRKWKWMEKWKSLPPDAANNTYIIHIFRPESLWCARRGILHYRKEIISSKFFPFFLENDQVKEILSLSYSYSTNYWTHYVDNSSSRLLTFYVCSLFVYGENVSERTINTENTSIGSFEALKNKSRRENRIYTKYTWRRTKNKRRIL